MYNISGDPTPTPLSLKLTFAYAYLYNIAYFVLPNCQVPNRQIFYYPYSTLIHVESRLRWMRIPVGFYPQIWGWDICCGYTLYLVIHNDHPPDNIVDIRRVTDRRKKPNSFTCVSLFQLLIHFSLLWRNQHNIFKYHARKPYRSVQFSGISIYWNFPAASIVLHT